MTMFLTIAALIAALVFQAFSWPLVLRTPDAENRSLADSRLRIKTRRLAESTGVENMRANAIPCVNARDLLQAQSGFLSAIGFHGLPRVDSINTGWAVARPAKDMHAKYAPSKGLTKLDTAFRFETVCRCRASVFKTFRLQKHKSRLCQAAFATTRNRELRRSYSFVP
jgi:hypothetical protein